jgi:hypothetical protein
LGHVEKLRLAAAELGATLGTDTPAPRPAAKSR